jgi:hypothetical protein
MGMSTPDAISRVVENWRRSGLKLLPGVQKASLMQQLHGLNRQISRDVLLLYSTTGGFADYDTDPHFWSLWELPRVVSENAKYERPYILFADWAISAWCYCFRYENTETSSVLVDYFDGKKPRVISPSVGEFFSHYLTHPSEISDATWLHRNGVPQVFVDFQNTDRRRRLRLNCRGTLDDLEAYGIHLEDGLVLEFTDDELHSRGSVEFSSEERIWVAVVNSTDLESAGDG